MLRMDAWTSAWTGRLASAPTARAPIGEGVNRQRQASESVGATKKGLRGDEGREAVLCLSGALPPRSRIMGIPTAFQGFPPPGLSPGGRGEPQVVAPYVEGPVPDLQPALEQERLESTPSAGRDGGSMRAVREAGISLWPVSRVIRKPDPTSHRFALPPSRKAPRHALRMCP